MPNFKIEYTYATKRDLTVQADSKSDALKQLEYLRETGFLGNGEVTIDYVGELK